jgi:DNA-binding response OmpR family regulator
MMIDLEAREVTLHGRPVRLSKMEFDVLAYLARKVGRVATYDDLLEAVWNCLPGQGDPNLVTRCVYRLRTRLGEDAGQPEYIVSVRGVGYRLRSQEQWGRWSKEEVNSHS